MIPKCECEGELIKHYDMLHNPYYECSRCFEKWSYTYIEKRIQKEDYQLWKKQFGYGC